MSGGLDTGREEPGLVGGDAPLCPWRVFGYCSAGAPMQVATRCPRDCKTRSIWAAWREGVKEIVRLHARIRAQAKEIERIGEIKSLYAEFVEKHGITLEDGDPSKPGTFAHLVQEHKDQRTEIERLRAALEKLMDVQNGPPLVTLTEEWEEAMDDARAALEVKP